MKQDIPGTIMFDGDQAQKGLPALNRDVFFVQLRAEPGGVSADEDAYCEKFGLDEEQRSGMKSRVTCRCQIEAGGNVHYLGEACGDFRSRQRPGHRRSSRPARRSTRSRQNSPRGGGEVTMAKTIGGVATTQCAPSIGKAIAQEKKAERSVLEAILSKVLISSTIIARENPRRRRGVLQIYHGLNFSLFLDKLPTFVSAPRPNTATRAEGWGIPVSRSIPGDPALSWHLINARWSPTNSTSPIKAVIGWSITR